MNFFNYFLLFHIFFPRTPNKNSCLSECIRIGCYIYIIIVAYSALMLLFSTIFVGVLFASFFVVQNWSRIIINLLHFFCFFFFLLNPADNNKNVSMTYEFAYTQNGKVECVQQKTIGGSIEINE